MFHYQAKTNVRLQSGFMPTEDSEYQIYGIGLPVHHGSVQKVTAVRAHKPLGHRRIDPHPGHHKYAISALLTDLLQSLL